MPVPGSQMPVKSLRCTPIALALAGLVAPHAAVAQSSSAPPPQIEGALPEPGLKPAPRLTPPAPHTPRFARTTHAPPPADAHAARFAEQHTSPLRGAVAGQAGATAAA